MAKRLSLLKVNAIKTSSYPLALLGSLVYMGAHAQTIENLFLKSGLSKNKFNDSIGLPKDVDPTKLEGFFAKFNDPVRTPQMEKIIEQVTNTLDTFSSLAKGAGASIENANAAVEKGLIDALKRKKLDFTKESDLKLIEKEIANELKKIDGFDMKTFKSLSSETVEAIKNVNTKIDDLDDISSSEAKKTLSKANDLPDQVRSAAEIEARNPGEGFVEFANIDALETALVSPGVSTSTIALGAGVPLAAIGLSGGGSGGGGSSNVAPTSFVLSANSLTEGLAGAQIGTLSATDANQDSLFYGIAAGGDNDYFEVVNNALKLKNNRSADYETQNTYNLTLTVSDGSTSTSLSTVINVTNVNEATTATKSDKGTLFLQGSANPSSIVEPIFHGGGWSDLGKGVDLTYSIFNPPYALADYDQDGSTVDNEAADNSNIYSGSSAMTNFLDNIFEEFSKVSLLNFHRITEDANQVGHIRVGTFNDDNAPYDMPGGYTISSSTLGIAGLPAEAFSTDTTLHHAVGDFFLLGDTGGSNDVYNNASFLSSYSRPTFTALHELGHALGFSHPHHADANTTWSVTSETWSFTADSAVALPDTVMAYAHYSGDGTGGVPSAINTAFPTSLMVSDIAAVQYKYGVNNQANTGDNTYTLSSLTNNNWLWESIWDAGGNDTISWSDQSSTAKIDLNAGSYSFFGKIDSKADSDLESQFSAGDGLLGIAYDCVIENAKGGTAADTIVGNNSDNLIYGGSGSGIKDTLTGNGGSDTFVCHFNDRTTNTSLVDVVTDYFQGTDKIGIEGVSVTDLSFSQTSGGTLVRHSASDSYLLFLDGVNESQLSSSDFVVTDFV